MTESHPATLPTTARNSRTLLPWYVCHFAVVFCYSMISNAVYFLCIYRLKVPPSVTLWIAAGGGLIYTFAAYFSGRLVDRWGAKRVLMAATASCVLIFLTGALAACRNSLALMAVVMFLLNILTTPSWPAIESALSRSPGTLRLGTRMMLYNLSWSSSTFIATPVLLIPRPLVTAGIKGTMALALTYAKRLAIQAIISSVPALVGSRGTAPSSE